MPDDMTPHSLSERLVRMEGKIDAYAAGQSATLVEHARRLDRHDEQLDELRGQQMPTKTSSWQVAGVLIAAVGGLGSLLMIGIALMQLVYSSH